MAKKTVTFSFTYTPPSTGYVVSEMERLANTPPAIPGDEVMSAKDVAAFLSVSTKTLERWRRLGQGPAWTRPKGSKVIYTRSAVDAFRASGRFRNSTESRLSRARGNGT